MAYIAVIISNAVFCDYADAAATVSKADLLEVLAARDAQFDNLRMTIIVNGVEKVSPFDSWEDPEFAAEQQLVGDTGAQLEYEVREDITVRGGEVTYERHLERSENISGNPRYSIPPQQWSSNASGRELDYFGSKNSKGLLMAKPRMPGADSGAFHAREIEFALGFGIGGQALAIDRAELDERGLIKIQAMLKFGENGVGRCAATIDPEHYIARSARIVFERANPLVYEITTEGTAGAAPFYCAERGHLKTYSQAGKKELRGREFDVRVVSCELNLSDDRYASFTTIPEMAAGSQIMDPNGLILPVEAVDLGIDRDSHSPRYFAMALTVFFIIILIVLIVRKRRVVN